MATTPAQYIQRQIDVTINLVAGQSAFAGGANSVKLSGLRVSAKVSKAATPSAAMASVQVYGMTLSLMNQIATLGFTTEMIPKNTLTLMAGDSVNGMSQVFQGTILRAWFDGQSMPQVPFHIECQTNGAEAVIPQKPTSISSNSADVSGIMQTFANNLGLPGFENNNVTTKLAYPYFYGSYIDQIAKCAASAGCNWDVDPVTNNLVIWPKDGSRTSQTSMPLISPETGMIGYPTLAGYIIIVKTLYNPSIKFGAQVQVKSSLLNNGKVSTWTVQTIDHSLQAQFPHGEWFTTLSVYNPNAQTVRSPLQ